MKIYKTIKQGKTTNTNTKLNNNNTQHKTKHNKNTKHNTNNKQHTKHKTKTTNITKHKNNKTNQNTKLKHKNTTQLKHKNTNNATNRIGLNLEAVGPDVLRVVGLLHCPARPRGPKVRRTPWGAL